MSHFVVLDETVRQAFEQLRNYAFPAAKARADRERREGLVKAERARGFLEASGTVAEREARALQTDSYIVACEDWYAAIELDEQYRNLRSNAELVIEAWRSTNVDRRAREKAA